MIYYFLPSPGLHGGVKVGCQFTELLIALGLRAVVALPEGIAPTWFRMTAPVVDASEAAKALGSSDTVIITWPPDYERFKRCGARLVNHCQGTDEAMYPILADPNVEILTCWRQATEFLQNQFGRQSTEVGIFVSDEFFFRGAPKYDNMVAYMPRRGYPLVRACMRTCGDVDFVPIDGLGEADVSRILQGAGIFLATSVGEQFGLPALEAMAAGCLVVSVPVKGGMEYLRDGDNCLVAEPENLAAKLHWLTRPENSELRSAMRHSALATAWRYRREVQMKRLRVLLPGKPGWTP